MIASLLPGLRELRAPLAAGYLWLAFAYLAVGSPTEVRDAPGPLRELLTVLPTMGTAATAIAVSFVAYLIGSLSQDLFDEVLPTLLERWSNLLPDRPRDPTHRKIKKHLADVARAADTLAEIQRTVSEEQRIAGETPEAKAKREGSRKRIGDELDRLLPMLADLLDELRPARLGELQAAGLSEAEKPEARRPMLEAEVKLRTAIVPPLVAVMGYLTVAESAIWAIGLLFGVALLVQAVARDMEARRLRGQHYRAGSVDEIQTELEAVVRDLSAGEGIDAWRLIATLNQVTDRLYRPL